MKKFELYLYFVVALLFTVFFLLNGARAVADGHVLIGCLMVLGSLVGVCAACSFGDDIRAKKWDDRHERISKL